MKTSDCEGLLLWHKVIGLVYLAMQTTYKYACWMTRAMSCLLVQGRLFVSYGLHVELSVNLHLRRQLCVDTLRSCIQACSRWERQPAALLSKMCAYERGPGLRNHDAQPLMMIGAVHNMRRYP